MMLSNVEKISSALGERFFTMQLCFNLLKGFRGKQILQVGCEDRDFGYDNADLFKLFSDLVNECKDIKYNIICKEEKDKRLYEINSLIYKNNNRHNINIIKEEDYTKEKIDLLVLHDIDYPIDELTKQVSQDLNYIEAKNLLNGIDQSEFDHHYGHLVNKSRERVLQDYKTFSRRLSSKAIVLLEGNDYPGGSQTLLAKRQLEREGFICLLDLKQSVWIRR